MHLDGDVAVLAARPQPPKQRRAPGIAAIIGPHDFALRITFDGVFAVDDALPSDELKIGASDMHPLRKALANRARRIEDERLIDLALSIFRRKDQVTGVDYIAADPFTEGIERFALKAAIVPEIALPLIPGLRQWIDYPGELTASRDDNA